MRINRREFIGLGSASVAFAGCSSFPLVADNGPKLRLGVMSDIHLTWNADEPGSYERIEKVLRYYRDRNVDGVVIAGDIADWGYWGQLVEFAELWRKVFPDDRGLDGRHVERLFVAGNHDIAGPYEPFVWKGKSILEQKEQFISTIGIGKAWERAFGEKYEPIWIRHVNGYAFTGANWGCEKGLGGFLAAHRGEIDPHLPYFHIQHPHPLGTIYDGVFPANSWNYDRGAAMKALVDFPNAVAISGHTHLPLTDERSIWQGAFTSVGTGSLSYISHLDGRENSNTGKRVSQMAPINPWPWKDPDRGHHLMVFEVYGDRIEIERLEAFHLSRVGVNWTVPTDAAIRPYEYKARSRTCPPPEFAIGAAVTVSRPFAGKNRKGETVRQVDVSFPTASAGGTRAYDYEVAVEAETDGEWKTMLAKRVFSPTYHLAMLREARTANCVFAADELPDKTCRFAVTPLSGFGTRGRTLRSEVFAT